jgi:Na+/H+ antiporter NhaC
MGEWFSVSGGWTLVGPMVAIVLALATKRIMPSLLAAIVAQALVLGMQDPAGGVYSFGGLILDTAFGDPPGEETVGVLVNTGYATISLFSVVVAAMVGLLEASGATRSLVAGIQRVAKGRRGAMTSTWLAGGVVFFDDYANCIIVGRTMQPLCDQNRVSRAKLAYLVDATAAPIASLAVVSTWVGFEVDQLAQAMGPEHAMGAFELFLASLPYRMYCIMTLVFVGAIALTGRDFGPMWEAEQEAQTRPVQTHAKLDATSVSGWLAGMPILLLLALTFALLYMSGLHSLGMGALGDEGTGATLAAVLGEGRNTLQGQGAVGSLFTVLGAVEDAFTPMLHGALAAFAAAWASLLATRSLSVRQGLLGSWRGARSVLGALAVLYLAWTLGTLIKASGAGIFLEAMLGDHLTGFILPPLTFLIAALTAFSTGSSFFTMAVLIPIALALAPAEGVVLLATSAAVLDGAVLGDHASPISDTTVLSSMGAGVDVAVHVRTQLPYVLVVGCLSVVLLTVVTATGMSPWIYLPAGGLVCVAIVRWRGRLPHSSVG